MRNLYLGFFILVISLFINDKILAQESLIIKGKYNKYQYEEMTFSYDELEYLLKSSPAAYSSFKKYKKRKKVSKILGWTSLGLIGTGILIGDVLPKYECSSGGICANFVYGVLVGVSSIIPGTIALIYHFKANSAKNKSIQVFNSERGGDRMTLQLGFTSNGVGVILNF